MMECAPCVAAVDMSSFYVFYRFMLVLELTRSCAGA